MHVMNLFISFMIVSAEDYHWGKENWIIFSQYRVFYLPFHCRIFTTFIDIATDRALTGYTVSKERSCEMWTLISVGPGAG